MMRVAFEENFVKFAIRVVKRLSLQNTKWAIKRLKASLSRLHYQSVSCVTVVHSVSTNRTHLCRYILF